MYRNITFILVFNVIKFHLPDAPRVIENTNNTYKLGFKKVKKNLEKLCGISKFISVHLMQRTHISNYLSNIYNSINYKHNSKFVTGNINYRLNQAWINEAYLNTYEKCSFLAHDEILNVSCFFQKT